MLSELVEALQIFLKYGDQTKPTNCDHDIFRVFVDPSEVSKEDKARLKELGFEVDNYDLNCFYSYVFGSN